MIKNTLKIKQKVSKAIKMFKILDKKGYKEPTYIKFLQDRGIIRCETDGVPLVIFFTFSGEPTFDSLSVEFKLLVNGGKAYIFNKSGRPFPEELLTFDGELRVKSLEIMTKTGIRIKGDIIRNYLINNVEISNTKPEDSTEIVSDNQREIYIKEQGRRQVKGFRIPQQSLYKGRFQKTEKIDANQIKSQTPNYLDKIRIVKNVIKERIKTKKPIKELIKKEEALFVLNNKQKKASEGAY